MATQEEIISEDRTLQDNTFEDSTLDNSTLLVGEQILKRKPPSRIQHLTGREIEGVKEYFKEDSLSRTHHFTTHFISCDSHTLIKALEVRILCSHHDRSSITPVLKGRKK